MQYDFNLAPGAAQRFEVVGKFFKNTASTGLIRVTTSKGEYVELKAGQGVYGVEFSAITVKDISGAANVGSILIGDFDFRDDTINGTIKVMDNSYVRVRACEPYPTFNGSAFAGCGVISQSVAGGTAYSCAVLYNPVGSGKNTIISKIRYVGANTPSPTVRTAAYVPAGVTKCASKLAGGADSLSVMVVETIAAANAAFTGRPLVQGYGSGITAEHMDIPLSEPIILPPGKSLLLHNNDTAGTSVIAWTVQFTEEVL